jgi:hypothetical protein
MDPGAGAVWRDSLAESFARTAQGCPVGLRRAAEAAYRTMIGFRLFAVIASVVDWSRFRWA